MEALGCLRTCLQQSHIYQAICRAQPRSGILACSDYPHLVSIVASSGFGGTRHLLLQHKIPHVISLLAAYCR